MGDDVRRAYAVLGLAPGASPEKLRRRYRALVRTWHPDRFASDPLGQAAATERLAQTNAAYRLLAASRSAAPTAPRPGPRSPDAPAAAPARPPGARLSREEIDRMVRAIGSESWLESALGSGPPRRERLSRRSRVALALATAALLVGVEARTGHLADLLWIAAAVVALRAWAARRRR